MLKREEAVVFEFQTRNIGKSVHERTLVSILRTDFPASIPPLQNNRKKAWVGLRTLFKCKTMTGNPENVSSSFHWEKHFKGPPSPSIV